MRYYQLTYLISPDLSKEELKSLTEKINSLIQEEGGILANSEKPERKDLAFEIKKKNSAFLAGINFYLKPEKIEKLEKKIKSEEKILSHLILTKKAKKPKIAERKRKIKREKVEISEIEKKLKEILDES
jgi:ribosomal protein S6